MPCSFFYVMVDSAPEVDLALLGSTVGTLLSVYQGLGTASVFSAMLGPLWYMLCVCSCRSLQVVDFLSWCRGRFPWSCLWKTMETPQLQYLPGGLCSCCAGRVPCPLLSTSAHGSDPAEIRGGSAVAVPPVVDVAVLCSDKLSRDSESATDSVHRWSQWTFQSPQRQVSTVAVVHGRLLGGDEW